MTQKSDEAQLKHDLNSAMRTLRNLLEEIKSGYRFEDSDGDELIQLFDKAVVTLESYFAKKPG